MGCFGANDSNGVGGSFTVVSFDPGAIVSIHFTDTHALYVSPRVRWEYLDPRSWVDDDDASSSGATGYRREGTHEQSEWVPPKRASFSTGEPD